MGKKYADILYVQPLSFTNFSNYWWIFAVWPYCAPAAWVPHGALSAQCTALDLAPATRGSCSAGAPPVFIRSWSSPTFGCLVLRRLLIFERVYQNLWKFDLFSSPVRPDGSYWHNLDLIKVSHEFFKNPKISLVWSHVKTRTLCNRRLRQCKLYPKNTKASILFPKNGLNCE